MGGTESQLCSIPYICSPPLLPIENDCSFTRTVESGNIRTCLVCQSILAHFSVIAGWFFFTFATMVPAVVACKIKFGSVQNFNNYMIVIFFINFVFVVISQRGMGWVISNRGLMPVKYTLALCQNVAFMTIISILYVYSDIWEMNGWIVCWVQWSTTIAAWYHVTWPQAKTG